LKEGTEILVELHGGSVTASSDGEGCGATETPPAAVSGASPHPQRF